MRYKVQTVKVDEWPHKHNVVYVCINIVPLIMYIHTHMAAHRYTAFSHYTNTIVEKSLLCILIAFIICLCAL